MTYDVVIWFAVPFEFNQIVFQQRLVSRALEWLLLESRNV